MAHHVPIESLEIERGLELEPCIRFSDLSPAILFRSRSELEEFHCLEHSQSQTSRSNPTHYAAQVQTALLILMVAVLILMINVCVNRQDDKKANGQDDNKNERQRQAG